MSFRTDRIELLKRARELISAGIHRYACSAILHAADVEPAIRKHVAVALVREISNSIQPWSSVEMWLVSECCVLHHDITTERMRDYRVRWIDDMIKQNQKVCHEQ